MEELLKRLKFSIGDTGYFVTYSNSYPNCPSCKGTGKVEVNFEDKGIQVTCPSCNGYKFKVVKEYIVEECIISAIQIDANHIEYASSYFDGDWEYGLEKDWFKTREEAELDIKIKLKGENNDN